MPEIEFDTLTEELESQDEIMLMQALVRSSLAHGADNTPTMVVLTAKALYYGGTDRTGEKFRRVPLKSIVKSRKAGKLIWECIELTHMEIDGERTVYICPFKGSPAKPMKDKQSMKALLEQLDKRDG